MAVFVLGGNTLLRPLVDYVNRRPIKAGETEALYQVHATCAPADAPTARDLLYEELERYHYPVRDVEVVSEGDEIVELAATLVPTTATTPTTWTPSLRHLKQHADIEDATWTVSTTS